MASEMQQTYSFFHTTVIVKCTKKCSIIASQKLQKSKKMPQNIWAQKESKIVPKISPKCAQKWYNTCSKMCTKVGFKNGIKMNPKVVQKRIKNVTKTNTILACFGSLWPKIRRNSQGRQVTENK